MNKKVNLDKRVEKILFTKKQIDDATTKAAQWVDKTYKGKQILLVGILKGVVPFLGHLMVKIKTDLKIDFMVFSSYQGNVKAVTKPKIVMDLKTDIKGLDVLIVEDIVDTGKTLYSVVNLLKKRKPKSLKVLTLLDKKNSRTVPFQPDYNCFEIPNHYVVGFGFDHDDTLRNLPYIGILKKEIYESNLSELKKGKKKCQTKK